MHPILFKLQWMGKEVVIGTYGVMMVAALASGAALSLLVARKRGYAPSEFVNYCMVIMAGVIIGALLAGFLLFLPERAGSGYIDHPTAWVSWGGILGGIGTLLYIKHAWHESFLNLADIITPGYMVGLGIGRIGCLFAGCCYGVHGTTCIAVTFTDPVAPASAMVQPLVPTQLISAVFLICAGLVLLPLALKGGLKGFTFSLSAIIYSCFRFAIEFWRDDPRVFIANLSDGQVFSIGYFLMGMMIMIYLMKSSRSSPFSKLWRMEK
ncbi:MAG: prolipoprotein diacylglyceryl transferase [Spirochaetes bacterium]|nr:prolipoprotein diacylglyceryl transferase [Spirochaetota bacterium]